jgi:protochlorophyllide reductase
MPYWTERDIPDQTGRVVIVTGANNGLGFESSLALAKKGATVVMACRNLELGQQALDKIKRVAPQAELELARLDLSELASVRNFAESFKARHDRLDVLMNNAGVMAIPRAETKDGFEMQFGVNHLGHFALAGLLLDKLLATPRSRMVAVSSMMHMIGNINFNDLQSQSNYGRYKAYGQSKIANIMFALELQRRLRAIKAKVLSVAAHPGYASTNLQKISADPSTPLVERLVYPIGNQVIAQSAAMGALPQLYAATAPGVEGGAFYGPFFISRGYPRKCQAVARAYDEKVAKRLWAVSEELTKVHFDFGKPASVEARV